MIGTKKLNASVKKRKNDYTNIYDTTFYHEMSRHTGFSLYLQKDLMNTVVFTFHEKLVAVEYYNCHGNCTYQIKRRSTGISIYFSHAAA